ncbi:hypothetical protein [Proteus sp. FZP2095]|uniref:hypothetical protein n=1 Tax=Proteus sp. FZP2095 TaxID=2950158 RepID=UPI0020336ADF|nr:hypothetical protein [Proteus sp. FZP2095]MCM2366680.1 hypothetical protein [Proteus sp. FZP2095]
MELKIDRGTLLAVMECMAIGDVRYSICGICFLPNGKVAGTDGHMLAYGEHDNEIENEVILSVGKLPTKQFDYAIFDTDDGIVRLFSDKNTLIGVSMCSVIDGRFPHIDKLIEKTRKMKENLPFKIGINVSFLAKLQKIAKYVNPKMPAIELQFKTGQDAIICDIFNPYKPVSVLIMPMRI